MDSFFAKAGYQFTHESWFAGTVAGGIIDWVEAAGDGLVMFGGSLFGAKDKAVEITAEEYSKKWQNWLNESATHVLNENYDKNLILDDLGTREKTEKTTWKYSKLGFEYWLMAQTAGLSGVAKAKDAPAAIRFLAGEAPALLKADQVAGNTAESKAKSIVKADENADITSPENVDLIYDNTTKAFWYKYVSSSGMKYAGKGVSQFVHSKADEMTSAAIQKYEEEVYNAYGSAENVDWQNVADVVSLQYEKYQGVKEATLGAYDYLWDTTIWFNATNEIQTQTNTKISELGGNENNRDEIYADKSDELLEKKYGYAATDAILKPDKFTNSWCGVSLDELTDYQTVGGDGLNERIGWGNY